MPKGPLRHNIAHNLSLRHPPEFLEDESTRKTATVFSNRHVDGGINYVHHGRDVVQPGSLSVPGSEMRLSSIPPIAEMYDRNCANLSDPDPLKHKVAEASDIYTKEVSKTCAFYFYRKYRLCAREHS